MNRESALCHRLVNLRCLKIENLRGVYDKGPVDVQLFEYDVAPALLHQKPGDHLTAFEMGEDVSPK